MAIKVLYSFKADKEIEVEAKEERDGGVFTKKVKELHPVTFALRKVNRQLADDNSLFYGVQFTKAIQNGLMPRALLAKRFNNDNGVFSDAQVAERQRLFDKRVEIANEITKFLDLPEDKKDKETEKNIVEEYNVIQRRLDEYDNAEQGLFENSAENRARDNAILWYTLFLSYQENDKGELVPVFAGNTFEEKLGAYDAIVEEENPFLLAAIKKLTFFATALYLGRAQTEEDFKSIEAQIDKSIEKPEEKADGQPVEESRVE